MSTFPIRLGRSFHPSQSPDSRSLHTIRYNFEPDSVDKSKGSLTEDVKGEVTLNFGNTNQTSEEHVFKGQQAKAKESEYLLIFDEETNEYVLEKLSSTFNMRNVRQPKRSSASISNLEDERPESKTQPKLTGSVTTTGLMKPPMDFSTKIPHSPSISKSSSVSSVKEEEDGFSDLEDELVRDLSTSNDSV